jgi:hypothetical protein
MIAVRAKVMYSSNYLMSILHVQFPLFPFILEIGKTTRQPAACSLWKEVVAQRHAILHINGDSDVSECLDLAVQPLSPPPAPTPAAS